MELNDEYSYALLTRSSNGERVLLFCQADERHRWKLFVSVNDGEPIRLYTGFADEVIECSPAAWQDETGWHLSFIAGGATDNPLYHLFRMDGEMFETLSRPVAIRPAKTGFIYQDRMAIGAIQDVVTIHDTSGDQTIELPGAYIYRVSYRADKPTLLLITGQWIGEEDVFSIEYDLKSGGQRLIECDGCAAYKPTIYGNEVLYAERVGNSFESRRIRRAEHCHSKQCRIASRRQSDDMGINLNRTSKCRCNPKEGNEEAARPSCLECVEKHLGAAFVIASEIHDGYSYRLRLIGHLHEAEDESQEFSQLHEAIRQARKDYQIKGTNPDWEMLARLISETKNAY